jgi:V8-like Glu-specific endopeptidase
MNKAFLTLILCFTASGQKTICDYEDDRLPSYDQKIAKVVKALDQRAGCTITLIGNDCALSAGHCKNYFKYAIFNVPHGTKDKTPLPKAEDVYEVEPYGIITGNDKKFSNQDWAVIRLRPNKKTGLRATDLYGHYKIADYMPWFPGEVSITGYGEDRYRDELSYIQRSDSGQVMKTDKKEGKLTYRIDTTGGNSGSAIIMKNSNEIIGIHTKGGCRASSDSSNAGVLVPYNKELLKTVKKCLTYQN